MEEAKDGGGTSAKMAKNNRLNVIVPMSVQVLCNWGTDKAKYKQCKCICTLNVVHL